MSFWDKVAKVGASVGKGLLEEGKERGAYMKKISKMDDVELIAEYGNRRLTSTQKRILEGRLRTKGLL